MSKSKSASEWSIKWWQYRHQLGYFPHMEQHLDWRVYNDLFPWFKDIAQPRREDSCLEIGCGYGQWMIPLSRSVKSVVGVDIHPSLERKAREKFKEHGRDNCLFVLGDGKALPAEDSAFTLVYSISVFQHIPRALVRDYFQESDRVMRRDGRAVFHFRYADGGIYSDDIEVDHRGDFSVGWTEEEVRAEGERLGWNTDVFIMGDSAVLRGSKK